MIRHTTRQSTRAALRLAALAPAAILALTACEGGPAFLQGDGGSRSGEVRRVDRDVEAPDVFQVRDEGAWNGRPSFSGVWVAHPDVTSNERVIIRRPDSDQFVVGALFRLDEESINGPAFQISSDAAEALDLGPGEVATIEVTALREEEEELPEPPVGTLDTAEPIEVETLAAAATAEAAPAAVAAAATVTPDPSPLPAAIVEAATADAPPAPAPAAPTLSPIEAAASVIPPEPDADLTRPYLQIGIFSVRGNADRAADRLRGIGDTPRILTDEVAGKTYFRVTTAAAANAAERDALLARIRDLGYSDAYAVRG